MKIELHRNGLLAVAGIVGLVLLVGAVWTVAVLRLVLAVVLVTSIIAWRRQSLFTSQSTFNAIRKPKK